jgi:hypothetical protein
MKLPIFLQADDGVTWWTDLASLESSLESPDIEAGLYKAWDSDGQRVRIAPVLPVTRSSFFGLQSMSVSCGKVSPSGVFEQDTLCAVLIAHIKDACGCGMELPKDLPALVELLCRLQPQSR